MVALDKASLGEAEELRAVEASPAAEVDVLDDGVGAKLGLFQVALESPVVPLGELSVDEQAEALLEGERLVLGSLALVDEAGGHCVELEGIEALDRLVVKHDSSSQE